MVLLFPATFEANIQERLLNDVHSFLDISIPHDNNRGHYKMTEYDTNIQPYDNDSGYQL